MHYQLRMYGTVKKRCFIVVYFAEICWINLFDHMLQLYKRDFVVCINRKRHVDKIKLIRLPFEKIPPGTPMGLDKFKVRKYIM